MKFKDLEQYILKRQALNAALTLFSWDQDTEAPEESVEQTATYVGVLSHELFEVITDKKVKQLLLELESQNLSLEQKTIIKKWLKDIEKFEKIPAQKYQSHQELLMKAQHIWQKAKKENDYELFLL